MIPYKEEIYYIALLRLINILQNTSDTSIIEINLYC